MATTDSSHNSAPALTAWSIIANSSFEGEDRESSLVRLGVGYLYPIFAHLRSLGHAPQESYTYAQGFIQQLVGNLLASQPQERFRPYLYACLTDFSKRPISGHGQLKSAPELDVVEHRYGVEGELSTDLQVAFEQRYVRELMVRTMTRLRDEAVHNGKQALFDQLVTYLTVEPSTVESKKLSEVLEISPISLTIALKRLRARYKEISVEELAHTVLDPAELESERSTIHTILQ